MPAYDWQDWLGQWNRVLLEHLEPEATLEFPCLDLTPEIVEAG